VDAGRQAWFPVDVKQNLPTSPQPKPAATVGWTPITGRPCFCRPGQARDNCPTCEGTGMKVDFAAIRAARQTPPTCAQIERWLASRGLPSFTIDEIRAA